MARLIGIRQVCEKVGKSDRTIDRWEAQGKFPKRIKPTFSSALWDEAEIDAWIEHMKAARRAG